MEKDYYENPDNVENYSKFTPSHDAGDLVAAFARWVPPHATVLELGMGPGKDFKLLSERYRMTGSDFSNAFLDRYRATDAEAELLLLDALTLEMETERRFDAIYSNKVLVHFDAEKLRQSFARQHEVLNDGGVMFHSFWYGDGTEHHGELTLVRENEQTLTQALGERFEILELEKHAKMQDGDSIYVAARKK